MKQGIFRTKSRPGYRQGRNTGNSGKIIKVTAKSQTEWNFVVVEDYRTTRGSFNLANGRGVSYHEIPKISWSLCQNQNFGGKIPDAAFAKMEEIEGGSK